MTFGDLLQRVGDTCVAARTFRALARQTGRAQDRLLALRSAAASVPRDQHRLLLCALAQTMDLTAIWLAGSVERCQIALTASARHDLRSAPSVPPPGAVAVLTFDDGGGCSVAVLAAPGRDYLDLVSAAGLLSAEQTAAA